MSFDVFVQYFEDGEAGLVSINSLRDIFAPYVTEELENIWQVVYNDLNSSVLFLREVDDGGNIDGFCINRPCADVRLWESMYKCVSLGNCVIYWPGLEGLLSNRAEVSKHIPQDMLGSLGKVRVVIDYKEILRILKEE